VWTDAVLNRHIQHAIDRVGQASPRLASLTRVAPASPRRIDLSGDLPAAYAWVEAIEYPLDRYPQLFLPFREEPAARVYLLTSELPPQGAAIRVWYAARYAVDDSSSDMPVALEPAVLAGAFAFACPDQAADTIAKITPAGAGPEGYCAVGDAACARFEAMLTDLRTAAVRPLWRPSWGASV